MTGQILYLLGVAMGFAISAVLWYGRRALADRARDGEEEQRRRAEGWRDRCEDAESRAAGFRGELRGLVTDWPCPNPDDPEGCYCPGDDHVDAAAILALLADEPLVPEPPPMTVPHPLPRRPGRPGRMT